MNQIQPSEQLNQSNPPKLFTTRFTEYLSLILRNDEWIEIPLDLGIQIQETDKGSNFCHIEFPDDENNNSITKLWSIKAWRESLIRHAKAKEEALQRKIEWDNLKENLNRIMNRLGKITGLPPSDCKLMAEQILRKNPDSLIALEVELVNPYYRGEYTLLPFREPRRYDE